jgi:hypothetical protein
MIKNIILTQTGRSCLRLVDSLKKSYLRSLTYVVLSQLAVVSHAVRQRYHSINLHRKKMLRLIYAGSIFGARHGCVRNHLHFLESEHFLVRSLIVGARLD